MKLYEIHPALVHFPIAFLLAAVALDLYAWWKPTRHLSQTTVGLLIAGVVAGWLTAAAGLLAYYTVNVHTEEAHDLMNWHLGLNVAMLSVFTWSAVVAWRRSGTLPPMLRGVNLLAAVLLLIGGYLGGYIVYHGGAGIEPGLLAPRLREGHTHGGELEGHDPG